MGTVIICPSTSGQAADADQRKGVSQEDIVKLAAGSNIDENRVKNLLKRMTQGGELYSPNPGYYKIV